MAKTPRSAFLHPVRFDGIVSSICLRCLLTIARKPNETDLLKSENAHVCADLNLGLMFHPEHATDAAG